MSELTNSTRDAPSVHDARPDESQDARARLLRTIEAIAHAQDRRQRRRPRPSAAGERVLWSDHLIGDDAALPAKLRRATEVFVRLERASGCAPERLLVQLKRLVQSIPGAQAEAARAMEGDIVQWAIAAYFDKHVEEKP